MIYLLSEEGRRALRALVSRPLLYAFDFDGTLAPISPDRDAVKIPYSVSEWIKELAKRAPCAVVSGRALADLAPRVDGAVPHLIGNHGLESPCTAPVTLIWAENLCAGWMKQVSIDFVQPLKDYGVEVENKRYSLTFHYRGAEEPARICNALLLLLTQLNPAPRLILGKASVNVLPPGKGGKGPAALALMVHLRRTGLFFIGDDETDEDVFELTEGLAMGVRVGRHAGSRAHFYLKHQREIEEVLRFLVHRIDRTPESLDANARDTSERKKAAHEL
jgi:trehalose 6-phosphate phosphatase